MLIKVKKNWKDLIDSKTHVHGLSRRDFIARGLATGSVVVAAQKLFMGGILGKAYAATMTCPAPVAHPGAIAQIFSEGGPTMGARFIGDAQAAMMNSGIAGNYGISGTNLVQLGPNMWIDSTSPFGATLLQGPPGYGGGATPAASAALWKTNVLSKISGGGHLGPFNMDDGAGQNTGLLGGVSPFKQSVMGKDLLINNAATRASWAGGLPGSKVKSNPTAATLAATAALTPAATGLTNPAALGAASDAANALATAMSPVFNNATRKGASVAMTNAGCAFYGNNALVDPNYGTSLFTASGISALTSKLTVATLSAQEQALLAAYYQSANGTAGGIITEYGGRDYHGNDPITQIAPDDIEEARAIVMFLAACDAAQAPGSMIYLANGQAIANGTQNGTVTIGGQQVTVNSPVASGDAGGAYNAGLIIFYSPTGSVSNARFTGTVNSSSGNATVDPNISSNRDAVAGLYLSALAWVSGGQVPAAALKAM